MIQLQVTKKLEQTPQVLYIFGKVSGKLCAKGRSTDGGREVQEGKQATHPCTTPKKAPQTPIKQTKRTKDTNLGRNRFLNKVCQISKLFFFLRADAKCLFSLFWIEVSEHMLCFNKSWRNHNRETQTLMNNSVLEFGDTHQNSLRSSLSFSALFISDMQNSVSSILQKDTTRTGR